MAEAEVIEPNTSDKEEDDSEELEPSEVVYYWMKEFHLNGQALLDLVRTKCESDEKISYRELKYLVDKLGEYREKSCDLAVKYLPYKQPKLEAIEVKNQVEHRFVIRSPDAIANVSDWAKKTGATYLKIRENMEQTKPQLAPIAPSIHDFEEDDEDERKTFDITPN